jgi:hypothetical protein
LAWCLLAPALRAQSASPPADCPQSSSGLYSRIGSVGIDPARLYRVRDAAITRPNLNLTFESGTLAFTEDICGRITGALFEGDGEILLRPPNRVERGSMALFTGMAILEEEFSSAYLRFNDDTAERLLPFLSADPEAGDFLKEWDQPAHKLAEYDALRLLIDFSHFLPGAAATPSARKFPSLLHAHLIGKKLGGFEVFWDASTTEQLRAGQTRVKDGLQFFDIWTSFAAGAAQGQALRAGEAAVTNCRIRAVVRPPTQLQASAELNLHLRNGGQRTLMFELSRFLKVASVEADGRPVDFIQNPAIEGTELQRKGDDLIAIVFPAELKSGQELKMRFSYTGDVLSEAGSGLLYVGARGTWYPSFGLSPTSFDMEFRYPPAWTLVATGKQVSPPTGEVPQADPTETVSHWVSERPIPVAGFNLGKYIRAEARAGKVLIEAYSTKGVEKNFPKAPSEVISSPTFPGRLAPGMPQSEPMVITPPPPSPAREAQPVADKAAKAVASFSQWFGPYPYGSLAFTQMPGDLSQGWPGLVFLSSFAFLNTQEQADLRLDPVLRIVNSQVLVHEAAHQWWGDLVLFNTYREQWLSEALANYSSLLVLERQNPAQFRQVLEKYRNDLVAKNSDGESLVQAGPVTLGPRLISSHFPGGYETIAYERGTWLLHMLRSMLRDAETSSARARKSETNSDEPFLRGLRKICERYAGKSIGTREFIPVFEEELPRPLWYENRHKLDWFAESWINGTAIPELAVRDVRITEKAAVTSVSGVIVQKDTPEDFVTAIPVYGETAHNALIFLGEVLADGPETSFHLTSSAHLRKIVIDPKQTILSAPK